MRFLVLFAWTAGLALSQSPNFYKDVAPIFQKRCQECHRPGEIGPMPLLTYDDARPWAKSIRKAVLDRAMPPWDADAKYGHFSNDRSLSQAEIDTIVAWADAGAPAGDTSNAPPPREFTEGWAIGEPDRVFDLGVNFKVPAQGTVEYTYFVVPTGFTEDMWVKDIELRPGNKALVHHSIAFVRPKGSDFMANAQPGAPYVPPPDAAEASSKRPPQSDRAILYGINDGSYEMGATYVPGGVPYRTLPGQARLIPAGADLVIQMHYTANGEAGTDRSRVGMTFAKEPPKERVVNAFLMNESLRIPPGEANHRVDGKVTLRREAKLQSMFPHMHLRGKSFEYNVKLPTGESRKLLEVPNYRFSWQITYYLDEPITLPAGTELSATAIYDNSPNNRFNPDPTDEVFWGDQSWDEMFAGFVDLVVPAGVDPTELVRAPK